MSACILESIKFTLQPNKGVAMKRRFQSFGRQELNSPVAELIRKKNQVTPKCCLTCEFFMEENEFGYALNWCPKNNTSTEAKDYCDEYKQD